MPKGVKKIKMCKGNYYPDKTRSLTTQVTIEADQFVSFRVEEWLPDTTEAEKKEAIFWIRQSQDRKTIHYKAKLPSYRFKIPKKECGNVSYYIEGSRSGNRDFKNQSGIFVTGYAPKKIIRTQWTKTKGGTSIKNKQAKTPILYGDPIFLYAHTEGLNGYNDISVEIYNQQLGTDKIIWIYNKVACIDGDINLKIQNTSQWMSSVRNLQEIEQFFVKIKHKGAYIFDNYHDDEHAIYLNIKKQLVHTIPKAPENITPTKVYEAAINPTRYEPCKFTEINIIEHGKAPFTVFKDGQVLAGKRYVKQTIHRAIYFDFNDTSINNSAQKKLNNILGFLLAHPGSNIQMSGYACVIGDCEYNQKLSQNRSDAVKDFFTKGGLDTHRITSVGRGEYNTSDEDGVEHKNEKEYILARRVDISFHYNAHDAKALVYETIAPSSPKPISINVENFQVDDCYRADKKKHIKQILIASPDGAAQQKATSYATFSIQSTISKHNPYPLQYIWPKWNFIRTVNNQKIDAAALYRLTINSCSYYSLTDEATLIIKAYPDIKWTLKFFLNLTNLLAVSWKNQPASKHKELQKKSGKTSMETRWKQKETSFGFSLKSAWNKQEGYFSKERELKLAYNAKFKKFYDLFASMGNMSKAIIHKTKGRIRNIGFKNIPIIFEVKPPNLSLDGTWFLEKKEHTVGTNVDFSLNATPLIGLDITIDLLCLATSAVAGAITAGGGAKIALDLYDIIKGHLNNGIKMGTKDAGAEVKADVYIDLQISNTIKTKADFKFNTAGKATDAQFKLETNNTLKVEVKAGMWVKAEVALVVVKLEGYFEMSAKGTSAITLGHEVNYDDKGLYYRPELGFDGITADYVIKVKVGLSSTKTILKEGTPSNENMTILDQRKWTLAPSFDVVKSLEELFGFSANIPLIKN
ncbi:OmpA family protein [Tenacibaculum maritimum]|uniref:OmpA family protein n=1 Tax=Tenacibaculum maritimum TaxID=107401 RepID=UPI0012E63DDF|nr:OmpA family protein [Tenacibaculum maritimum]CAA0172934.1 conserved hypothetical protein [Tenacibaculum maritimum]CAA0241792.1 conserved hypothetical protein [Tenacibaculum maritimum]